MPEDELHSYFILPLSEAKPGGAVGRRPQPGPGPGAREAAESASGGGGASPHPLSPPPPSPPHRLRPRPRPRRTAPRTPTAGHTGIADQGLERRRHRQGGAGEGAGSGRAPWAWRPRCPAGPGARPARARAPAPAPPSPPPPRRGGRPPPSRAPGAGPRARRPACTCVAAGLLCHALLLLAAFVMGATRVGEAPSGAAARAGGGQRGARRAHREAGRGPGQVLRGGVQDPAPAHPDHRGARPATCLDQSALPHARASWCRLGHPCVRRLAR